MNLIPKVKSVCLSISSAMRTCRVRVYRDFNDMNGSHEAHNIIGIRLIPDGGVVQLDNRNLSYQDGIIGSIICSDLSMLVQDFRDLLIAELSDLPEEFRFLSKNGFPIQSTEEAKIEVLEIINYNLITVQRHFDDKIWKKKCYCYVL
ncbi:uncharacterized protein LOC118197339 [Stegodyphus dumicola]|uniref:uncharacterized protein LOC118197339 n=1 Tax=Stegodyphus dumicola TaxID=202533 RepID=UPI0015B2F61F|nr:uncharacterized protein LOC118197339 [Stegodyphus dumicola]